MKMTLADAKAALANCTRHRIFNSEIGDGQYYWMKKLDTGNGEYQVATGYEETDGHATVTIISMDYFSGSDARELLECGVPGETRFEGGEECPTCKNKGFVWKILPGIVEDEAEEIPCPLCSEKR